MKGARPDSDTLNWAIKSRNPDIVSTVVIVGALPSSNSLTLACQTEDLAIVKSVIVAGATPDQETLSAAVLSKQIAMISLMVTIGAKPASDTLTLAVQTQNYEVVKIVCDAHAQPDANTLTAAINTRNERIIALIKSLNARGDEQTILAAFKKKGGSTPAELLAKIKAIIDADKPKLTRASLIAAMGIDHREAFDLLLANGATCDTEVLSAAIDNHSYFILKILCIGIKPTQKEINKIKSYSSPDDRNWGTAKSLILDAVKYSGEELIARAAVATRDLELLEKTIKGGFKPDSTLIDWGISVEKNELDKFLDVLMRHGVIPETESLNKILSDIERRDFTGSGSSDYIVKRIIDVLIKHKYIISLEYMKWLVKKWDPERIKACAGLDPSNKDFQTAFDEGLATSVKLRILREVPTLLSLGAMPTKDVCKIAEKKHKEALFAEKKEETKEIMRLVKEAYKQNKSKKK